MSDRFSFEFDIDNLPTHLEMFYHWVKTIPDEIYMRQPIDGKYVDYTWAETDQQVRKIAAYLNSLKLPTKSNIALISKNCADWIIADLAIAMSGHISVPLYPTITAAQTNEIITHSESKVVFTGKLDDWESMKPGIPADVIGVSTSQSHETEYKSWQSILDEFDPMEESPIPDHDQLYSIMYTSGTTGSPKGVMLAHRNYQLALRAVQQIMEVITKRHRFFSYLPMSHIGERNVVEICSILSGGTVYFVESITTFAQNLQKAKPTIFFAVPRIWTKFQLGVFSKIPEKKLNFLLKIPLLNKIISKKIRAGLGLDQAEIVVTAAAPCPQMLHDWYNKIGISLLELYGMTENNGVCTIMPTDRKKEGSVGTPYPDMTMKIDPESGEILMKADWVMKGYYKEPELTAQVMHNGFLHTGDMGEADEDGYLKITGRVRDTFKTSKGKFIAPGPIEWGFAANTDVEQICVLGRNLPQPVALIVLSELANDKSRDEIIASLKASITSIIDDMVNYEQLKKAIIVKEVWSVENGILTPTLKIKRNVLENLYQDKLLHWYEQPDMVVWE